ncbi:hypothetical protein [Halobacterium rubrum]|uniref:hypothetical protein n=1 Tax=Halobacterium TaxID=2239 RepID=UPI001F15A6D8|nr:MULTISPECIES: hypothetical protein [Halobacterium]MDH5021808.1 hypothetical protein [Halobacterium rubrum]
MTVSAGGPSEKTCPTCGRDVDPEDYNQDAGECDRCQDTRRDDDESTASAAYSAGRDASEHVEEERHSTAATAVRAAAKRHAEEVNAGEKSPGGTAGEEMDG